MSGRISLFVGHLRGKLHVPVDESRAPALALVSNRNGADEPARVAAALNAR
jgi:hypothetical protein